LNENHFVNDIVNVGSDFEISILKLAQLVKEVLKSGSKIVHLPPLQEGDMRRRYPDISKMKKILSRELTSLEYGICAVADSFKKTGPG
jgi:UDP-glucose 4-epimerase